MLNPNVIPSQEPLIRVGIILPEDRIHEIIIKIPEKIDYQIYSNNTISETLKPGKITLKKDADLINVSNLGTSTKWKISPTLNPEISPHSGILVKDVIAGRGFHWQKFIDVFLSGSIEISLIENQLVLVNELPIEEYLMCVATSEMSAECPSALIEAQTITARSWMLANVEQKHVKWGMDVCNDDCCQRYQGTSHLSLQSIEGAKRTYGQVLLYDGKICDARYSKSCGGIMEIFSTIWPGTDPPYLENKFDNFEQNPYFQLPGNTDKKVKEWLEAHPKSFCSPDTIPESDLPKYLGNVDKEGSYFRWQVQYSQQELTALLNDKLDLQAQAIYELKALSRGGSGRIIKLEITFRNDINEVKSVIVDRDVEIRRVLHKNFMYSSCIDIESSDINNKIPENFTIKGAGWGHGVGLCQIGALGMSLKGYSTEEILYHYFPGSKLEKIY